jgi:uncharacterized protein YhfF
MGRFSAAGELGALIVAGIKTATCSALRAYEAEREPLPSVGLKTIVLDGMRTGATSRARCLALAESRLWICRWYASGFV